MTSKNLHDFRKSYEKGQLRLEDVHGNPHHQFHLWFEEAVALIKDEANAFTLSTCGSDMKPSSRTLLLKEYAEDKGFVFYTNYQSRKGTQMEENPNASILFFWPEMERQVRIEGSVSKISREESIKYFKSRPIGSQKGAIISPQSQPIQENELEDKLADLEKTNEVACPENWGGYSIVPKYFEFWQGKPSRLHDRITYKAENNSWTKLRIAP